MDDLTRRAAELWAEGKLEQVVRLLEEAPALEPQAKVRLAAACIRLGRLARAAIVLAEPEDGYGALQLGNALRYLGEVERAAPQLERAYAAAKSSRDGTLALAALCAQGELALDRGEAREAVLRFGKALGLTEFTAREALTVAPLAGLAQAHLLWGNPHKARSTAEKALGRAKEAGDKVGEVRSLLSLGLVLKDEEYFAEAAELAETAPHQPLRLRALTARLELNFGAQRYQQALALAEEMRMRPELLRLRNLQEQEQKNLHP